MSQKEWRVLDFRGQVMSGRVPKEKEARKRSDWEERLKRNLKNQEHNEGEWDAAAGEARYRDLHDRADACEANANECRRKADCLRELLGY